MPRTRIGIAVNEISGDQLGASLLKALRKKRPDLLFEGMTGPLLEAEGCRCLEQMEPVMGLAEVLEHLPRLLRVRRRLIRHFQDHPPDLFIGVDAPDFNLALEQRLKASGIKTSHFVCPTVWAWRQGRARRFNRAVDLMLCIFSFEVDFLSRFDVNAVYVGHPMADEIPLHPLKPAEQRSLLGLAPERPAIAILPGSRMSEVSRLADDFLLTAKWCHERHPELQFVAPMANTRIQSFFASRRAAVAPGLPLILLEKQPRQAIQAAEVVLVASGTATLETLLHKRPMVAAYRVSPLTYWLIKHLKLLKVPYVALANLLSETPYAPEFLQHDCRPEAMGMALLEFLESPQKRAKIATAYQKIHESLRCNAAERAADAVLALIGKA